MLRWGQDMEANHTKGDSSMTLCLSSQEFIFLYKVLNIGGKIFFYDKV